MSSSSISCDQGESASSLAVGQPAVLLPLQEGAAPGAVAFVAFLGQTSLCFVPWGLGLARVAAG